MSSRYYCPTDPDAQHATLAGTEAHHLIHVMRVQPGEEIVLLDGAGYESRASVEKVTRREVHLRILDRNCVDRELPFELTLAVALPKGDRQRWLVEKAVELGVTSLVPLRTARSVAVAEKNTLERLRRAVIEASKQCGRNWLMRIEPAQEWRSLVEGAADNTWRCFAHPTPPGEFSPLPRLDAPPAPDCKVLLAIGPEGGLIEEEVAQATSAGWQSVDLGPRILRIETAAVYLISLVTRGR